MSYKSPETGTLPGDQTSLNMAELDGRTESSFDASGATVDEIVVWLRVEGVDATAVNTGVVGIEDDLDEDAIERIAPGGWTQVGSTIRREGRR